jgi:hypothetical protein
MHHRALVVDVVDGDATVPEAVPSVGAEEAVGDVAQEDVAGVPGADGLPQDGVHVLVVVAQVDAEAEVARRRRVVGRREVPAIGGAVEEDAGGAVVQDAVHLPRHVHRPAAPAAQGHPHPVLVGVEVPCVHAAPQPHVRPVGELLHRRRGRRWWRWCSRRGGGRPVLRLASSDWVSWLLVLRRRRAAAREWVYWRLGAGARGGENRASSLERFTTLCLGAEQAMLSHERF